MVIYKSSQFESQYDQVYSEIELVLSISETIKAKDIKRIFLIGSGGAYTKFYSVKNYLSKHYESPVIIEFPKQFEISYLDELHPQDLIVLGSKTGSTDEILELGKKLKDVENLKIGFIGDQETPLDSLVDFKIRTYMTDVHLVLLWTLVLGFTDYPHLQEFVANCKTLATDITKDFESLAPIANRNVEKNLNRKFQMWITSGNLFGEIRCFCNYMLEEIQWINSQAVHSGEYFHGPLEIIQNDVSMNIVINRNEFREMDERVNNFAEKYGNGANIVDMSAFKLESINPKFTKFLDPYVLNVYFDYLLQIYEHHTKLNSSTRKFYRKVGY